MAVNVSFDDVKSRVVIGEGFELVRKLTSLAYDALKSSIVVTDSVIHAVSEEQRVVVDTIQPSGAGKKTRTIYELLEIPFVWQDTALGTRCESDYQRAFQTLTSGDYNAAATQFVTLLTVTQGLDNSPLRRHAVRLLGVCEDHLARQINGPYVRTERCPWDVLQAERMIVQQQRQAIPQQVAQQVHGVRPAQHRSRQR